MIVFKIILSLMLIMAFLAFVAQQLKSKAEKGLEDPSLVLSMFNKGTCIEGVRKLKMNDSMRHSLVVGQSGSGKTQAVFLTNLLRANKNMSYVVHDPSGEMRENSKNYLETLGFTIKTINLAFPNQSHSYNPLKRLDSSYGSAKRLANILVTTTLGEGSNDRFWNLKAEQILAFFICFIKSLEPKYHNMATVLQLLNSFSSNPIGVDTLIAEKCTNKELFEEYKNIASIDAKLMSNILATTKASIAIFENEEIRDLTINDDIDFSELRQKPMIIFLQSSIMKLRFNAPLFSLIITQLMEEMIHKLPKKDDRAITMLLDEMGVLLLPNFSDFLANCRKYNVACVLGCQTTYQIISKYGKEEGNNIIANCYSQLFFSNQPIETCQILEKIGGYYEEELENGKKERHLTLPAHEIRILPKHEAILLIGGFKPMKVKLTFAYESYTLKNRMKMKSIANHANYREPYAIPSLYVPKPKRVKG
jgi:type IV secretory pathway TraG/TraD family ATPase VirD4